MTRIFLGCCNKNDCEPVEPGAIVQTKDGYRVRYWASPRPGHPVGFLVDGFIPFNDTGGRIRPSRDNQEHGCANPSRLICIYLPMMM